MKYYIKGKKWINLTQKDFIAKGGQGKVYGKGQTIYKIYTDTSKMISETKMLELKQLDRPNILIPDKIILDIKNTPAGFTMKWIKHSIPLCKLFTNDFRNRNRITEKSILELVENIKETIYSIHKKQCLMVDGNEFNYLVDKNNFTTPYFIDVDSYQTPGFPANVIMPSIRDWHNKTFSQLTDWFSFAIVACQLFVGIHPFKGRHEKFKKNDIQARMKANVSIFNPNVNVPPAARDFSKIPSQYFAWFTDIFEKGKRTYPPVLPGQIIIKPVKPKSLNSTDKFEIKKIKTFDSDIIWHWFYAGISLSITKHKIYINNKNYKIQPDTDIIFTNKKLYPVFALIKNNKLKLTTLKNNIISFPDIQAHEKMVINNTLYLKHNSKLTEIDFEDIGSQIVPAVKNVWNIMPNSSEIFQGVIYQNVLGKPYLVIPIPKKNRFSQCIIKLIPELQDYRIINAKHDLGVCILTAHKNNSYDRIVIRFDKDYENYDFRITKNIDFSSVNFITLEKGIVISMNDDDSMEIFFKNPDKKTIKHIKDQNINSSIKLCKEGNSVMFFKNKKLYKLRMNHKY